MKKEELRARLLATFRTEAEDHIENITTALLALEGGPPAEDSRRVLEETFREMHTLKGAARSVGLTDVESICQSCETVLNRLTREGGALSPEILNQLHASVKEVTAILGRDRGAPAPGKVAGDPVAVVSAAPPPLTVEKPHSPVVAPPPASPPRPDTLRVATEKLDTLLVLAEELAFPKLAAGERVREARDLLEAIGECRDAFNGRSAATPHDGHDGPRDGAARLRNAEARARDLLGRLVRDQRALGLVVEGLQSDARRLRMSPAASILGPFPSMVRDLASQQGKEAEWSVDGADLELDRKVLESLKEPLIHLVRNAVDHGIEPRAQRAAAGKPARGQIAVRITPAEGGRLEVTVRDDGAGVDPARVKGAAVRSRLLTGEEAERLSEEAALDLLFRSGLSTSPVITDVSGHGLGLAIVKEQVERLGGTVGIETRLGAGTAVRMIVPATVATFRGLLAREGRSLFLFPQEAVGRVTRLSDEEVQPLEGRETMVWGSQPISLTRLSDLLGLPRPEQPPDSATRWPCLIVESGPERLAVRVDEILGEREVLVKELQPPLVRVRNVAGAGLLGTGELALILRPTDLLRSARQVGGRSAVPGLSEARTRPGTILVVDDSITTRTMEKNLLEAAGYEVRLAVDGMEAWTALRTDRVDLVVSDVDMPRMDGFELTERIREDRELKHLPIILVTALESREDKERGVDVGANAYLVKSSFDQSNLLEIIRRLL